MYVDYHDMQFTNLHDRNTTALALRIALDNIFHNYVNHNYVDVFCGWSSLTNIHGGRYRPKSTYDIYLQKTILVNSSETYRSIILKVMHEKWSAKLLQDALNVDTL